MGQELTHIFFHSLILYPELAFGKEEICKGFDDWMMTASEYKKILESLYRRGYVLVKQKEWLDGKAVLPQGKKPLVISFDDVNYYRYMQGYGFAKNMFVDEDGVIKNEVVRPDGTVEVSEEGDAVPILERFIQAHPDFSHEGARGILAVTGYEGILGFPFTDGEEDAEENREKARVAAERLKAMGYEFACHSFTHNSIWFKVQDPPYEKVVYDTDKWKRLIEPVVGKTDCYISPFGFCWKNEDPRYRYIIESGFTVFCPVGATEVIRYSDHTVVSRYNIDGFSLKNRRFLMGERFFCPETVTDEKRVIKNESEKTTYELATEHTAEALAAYAAYCLKKKTVYMFGALMEPITEDVLARVTSRYPNQYPPERVEEFRSYIGTDCYGTDCSGLIKSFYWGGINVENYDEGTDWNSAKLLYCSAKSGSIKTLPELPGICLYMKGHVGIYVGNGKVIQSTRSEKFGDGVVMADLEQQEWTRWFMCPLVKYPELPKRETENVTRKPAAQKKKGNVILQKLNKGKKLGTVIKRIGKCGKTVSAFTGKPVVSEMKNLVRQVYRNQVSMEVELTRRILEAKGTTDRLLSEEQYYAIGAKINKERYLRILTDKNCFMARMSNLIKREYLDFSNASDEQVIAFCKRQKGFIVKDSWMSGGRGIQVYRELPEDTALRELINQWRQSKRELLLEELLVPHKTLAAVFPDSLCTVRIHTLLCGKEARVVLNSSIRFGRKGTLIDLCENSYTLYLEEDGTVLSGGAMNKFSMELEQKHKDTGAEFSKVSIPYWNECCALVKEAAKHVPEVPFVAWDVAITDTGVDLIEGNFLSGNILPQQLFMVMTGRSTGLRPVMDELLREVSESCEEV